MQSRRLPMVEPRQFHKDAGQQEQQAEAARMMILGFKKRKGFRFCRCDEFGTWLHRLGANRAVRLTPLGRELILSKEMRLITETLYKVPGIYEWEEYRRQLPSIRAHVAAITAALERYRARRAARGLFQLVPKANSVSFQVVSPLYALPLPARAEAVRRCRIRRQKRKAAAQTAGSVCTREA